MHTSRMRTARSLPVQGWSLSGGGGGSLTGTPPPIDRQTPVKQYCLAPVVCVPSAAVGDNNGRGCLPGGVSARHPPL